MPNFQAGINQILGSIGHIESQFKGEEERRKKEFEKNSQNSTPTHFSNDSITSDEMNEKTKSLKKTSLMLNPDRYNSYRIMQETANKIREKIKQKEMYNAFMKYINPEDGNTDFKDI